MARLFKDGAGATYDSANAKFVSVPFGETAVGVANPGGAYEPFNFVSTTALLQKADMTAVANAFDCGECHVGGGTMEYLPGSFVPLREIETSAAVPGGALAGKVTAFNYFVDQYDVDGDGEKFEAQHNDWAQTGVVEMDCLICHLNGYQYADRKAALRKNRFDATRPVGAGIATARTDIAFGNAGYGTAVVYDATKLVAVDADDPSQGYILDPTFAANIKGQPPTANCSSCHFDEFAVDWKKRGDSLAHDVHFGLGCMACHERKDKDLATVGTSGGFNYGVDKAKLGLCDPAKGNASPFDALANNFDDKNFKECAGCHEQTVDDHYNAPIPATAHAAKGFDGSVAGVPDHLAFISCEACHVKKAADITGGSFVDGTGVDHEGRVADHEHHDAAGQTDRVAMVWNDGWTKLHPVNLHTSFFIRSKADRPTSEGGYDLNADGRTGGVDGILQTHMAEVTGWTAANALLADGYVDSVEINNLFLAIEDHFDGTTANLNGLPVPGGAGFSGIYPKLSFMTVPFKNSHNIAQSNQAWGVNGCTDCHGANKGFYNGAYDLNAGYSIEWSKGTQMSPMTKVNGFSQATYTHPNVKTKGGTRSIAVDSVSATGLRNVGREEFLYETTFMARDTAWKTVITGGNIAFPAAPASFGGSLLKLEICSSSLSDAECNAKDPLTGALINVTTRTYMYPGTAAQPADEAALVTAMGGFATNFEFTVAADAGGNGIVITADEGYKLRLAGNADGWSYNLPQYVAAPRTGLDTNSYADRASWVAYLNTLGQPAQAAIATIDGNAPVAPDTAVTVTAGEAAAFVAADAGGLNPTYSWNFGDGTTATGPSVSKTYATAGTRLVVLTVTDSLGNFTKATQYVKALATATPDGGSLAWVDADGTETPFDGALNVDLTGVPHTKIYVMWNDLKANQTVFGTGNFNVNHTFRALSLRLVDTDADETKDTYRYPVKVRVYNGTALVKELTLNVDVAKP